VLNCDVVTSLCPIHDRRMWRSICLVLF